MNESCLYHRCGDPVQRIEQSALGTVFLCTYGGSKHGQNGCRRTYLSQRDLNAHIGHRHLKHEIKDQNLAVTAQKAGVVLSSSKVAVNATPSQPTQQQAFLEQFTSAMRQVAVATAVAVRPPQENLYMQGQAGTLQHTLPISTAHQPPVAPVLQSQHVYTPAGSIMQSLPSSQPVMSQSLVASTADSYTSSIPVLGSRIKTLISVPIQDDDYSKKQQQQTYQTHPTGATLPNMSYPPPSIAQYPVGSIAPNIHQPPPGVPPPMFSSQSMPSSSFTSPPPGPVPQMIQSGPPRAPPRMGGPPGAPRFFDNQGPRGPWTTAPPRGPSGPPHPPRGPTRADYNYY